MTKESNKNITKKKVTFKKKKPLKQFGGSNTINVLSWNICWQAMLGVASGSAPILGKVCGKPSESKPLNTCANNVIELIDRTIDCDFIAIQEATKWYEIRLASNKLQQMGYVHHKSAHGNSSSHLATFYNKEKYIAIAVNIGTIKSKGRPYHIIYLQNKTNKAVYIFINLHNKHDVLARDLEKIFLAESNNSFITINDGNIMDADTKKNYYPMDWSLTNYSVILAGDFNDQNKRKYWSGLTLFNNSNIPHLKALVVSSTGEPPKTCCPQEDKKKVPLVNGDYILVNDAFNIKNDNYIPETGPIYPSSDHLPVLIGLEPNIEQQAASSSKTKYIYMLLILIKHYAQIKLYLERFL